MDLVGQVRETGEVISVLLAGEAGAVFVDAFEFAVTLDLGIGIVHLQRSQQGDERRLLCWGTGVGRFPVLVEPTLVTDADGVGIVATGMNADLVFTARRIEPSVTLDVVVIAYTLVMEARVVILPEHLDRVPLVATARRTMYNNQCDDPTHTLSFFLEHVCAAALYGERACNSGENGSQKLQYLPRFCPIDSYHNLSIKD